MQGSNKTQQVSCENPAALGYEHIHYQDTYKSAYRHSILDLFEQIEYGKLRLDSLDGNTYTFNGNKPGPEAYLNLHSWDAFDALIANGEVGYAEAYIEGLWDTDDLPNLLICLLVNIDIMEHYLYGRPLRALFAKLKSIRNSNSLNGSKRNIRKHYDLGNDFYSLWLDKSMTYSCALFGDNKSLSLEEAQKAKYHRILSKLNPAQGEHILEIGCGWGGFAEIAAQKGINITSITISEEQKKYAEERLRNRGLDKLAKIEFKDYREITDEFDYIVSIGMFEHVGESCWPTYFDTIKSGLKSGGRAIVQTITIDNNVFERTRNKHGFIESYIFPGGMLPSKSRFLSAVKDAGLECNEMFSFGQDYVITLRHWLERFEAQHEIIKILGYDESFIRMWRYYLASCIATFTCNRTDVIQAEINST